MARKRAEKQITQPALIADPVLHYSWKNVQQITRNAVIVIAGQEVNVLGVRQQGSEWYLSYIDPVENQRIEECYLAHESVYARL